MANNPHPMNIENEPVQMNINNNNVNNLANYPEEELRNLTGANLRLMLEQDHQLILQAIQEQQNNMNQEVIEQEILSKYERIIHTLVRLYNNEQNNAQKNNYRSVLRFILANQNEAFISNIIGNDNLKQELMALVNAILNPQVGGRKHRRSRKRSIRRRHNSHRRRKN